MKEATKQQTADRGISDKTVGEIVADDYRTASVFEKHGIDFCCGGKVALSTICREKGIEPAVILREIEAVKDTALERSANYAAWELSFLADFIVNTHHAYIKENSGQIAAHAGKIADVHGVKHPEVIEIARIFARIATDLADHLAYEEQLFFPAIKRSDAAVKSGAAPEAKDSETISAGLVKLLREHEEVGDAIHRIRHLAKEYEIPDDVCNTFALTYRELKEFEDDLHKHVHLENNILFPKAANL